MLSLKNIGECAKKQVSLFWWDYMIKKINNKKVCIQWTLSISTTLYLELLSISNKKLDPLDICVLCKLFLSLYLELLYLEQKPWSLATTSLPFLNFFLYKGQFTQQIEQKSSIFENSNVIQMFEIRKFDCNQKSLLSI